MAFVLNDRVKQTSTSTGTGTINLSATAETGFETFVAGIGIQIIRSTVFHMMELLNLKSVSEQ